MKLKTTHKNYFKNKKTQVFLIFLVLSTLFWTLTKLSKEYTDTIEFKTRYINLPKEKVTQNNFLEKMTVVLKSSGFSLLGYNMNTSNLTIDLQYLIRKNNTIYYFLPNQHLPTFQKQLKAEETIIKIYPDTLFFDFGKLTSKTIKVKPNLKITYKSGYNLLDKITISPKSIVITGPEKQIDSMQFINTKLLELNNVASSFKKKIALDIPKYLDRVHFSESKIQVAGSVEKFTEGSLKLKFELINVPKEYNISTFLQKVKITYKVSLKNFNKIQVSDFKVVCDFSKTQRDSLLYLVPKLVKQSNLVSDIDLVPNKIEFLIKK